MQNFEGQNAIINSLAVNEDDVLFSGGDNGSISFWDWKTGHRFQETESTAQPEVWMLRPVCFAARLIGRD